MRFVCLDLVRCIAIALILTAHIGQSIRSPIGGFFGIPQLYHVSLGGVAVTIFLMLSGSVLELQYGKSKYKYKEFIKKRIIRIYPVYYMSLVIGILVFCLKSWHETGSVVSSLSKLDVSDSLLTITACYSFVGKWGGPFVETSWFISLIVSMYFLFPLISYMVKRNPIASFVVLFSVSFVSRLLLGKYGVLHGRPLDWFPLCRVFEFSLGIYFAAFLPKATFSFFEPPKHLGAVISFVSQISFPLFLVHYPLLFLVKYPTRMFGVNQYLPIICYISISVFISLVMLEIDKRIPRSKILSNSR